MSESVKTLTRPDMSYSLLPQTEKCNPQLCLQWQVGLLIQQRKTWAIWNAENSLTDNKKATFCNLFVDVSQIAS